MTDAPMTGERELPPVVQGAQLSLFTGTAEDADAAARAEVRTNLTDTLFVEAGAGTGKTSALVDRIVALVRSGVPMRSIAAITFTEKAAAELRYRVREELERHAAVDAACATALDELDAAAVCTLHAFAQRLLTAFPIEAGLPPRIEIQDEIASAVAFDARWERFVDQMVDDRAVSSRWSCSGSRSASSSRTCARWPRRSPTTGTSSTGSRHRPRSPR